MAEDPARRDRLKDRLRGAGLRATRPRLAVLGLLDRAAAPLSHGEVVEALDGQGWDRATLYRNLNDLTDKGLLHRLDVGDHVWRFEAAHRDLDSHAHFVCTDCGEIRCLTAVEVSVGGDRSLGLLERSHEIQIRGTCEECA
jgi:Fur family transcriptional regulator, ferric uptake regulator